MIVTFRAMSKRSNGKSVNRGEVKQVACYATSREG